MDARGFAALDRSYEKFIAYSRDVRGFSPETLAWYGRAYRNFRLFWRGHPRLSGISLLDRWVAWNRTRICAATIVMYWNGVRSFYRFRNTHQHAKDLFAGQRAPERPQTIPKALSLEQCREVLEVHKDMHWHDPYVKERAHAIFATILYAGLRNSEIRRLTLDDIDLGAGTIHIRLGKGRGGGKDRIAYIPPQLDPILRRFIRCRERWGVSVPEFFAAMNGLAVLSRGALRNLFVRLRNELDFRVTPQILRHSFVTHMLQCGIPLHIASGLAGHASVKTTMGYLRVWNKEYEIWAARIRF